MPETAPHPWPALMSDETVGAYLDVSARLVWQLAATGDLPAPMKVPGKRCSRWRKEDVDDAVAKWGDEKR